MRSKRREWNTDVHLLLVVFQVSLESGLLLSYDARMLPSSTTSTTGPTPNLFTLSAHDSACTSFDISPHIPGCIATASTDRTVKLWNVLDGDISGMGVSSSPTASNGKEISLVTSRDLDAGKIFSLSFSPDDPLTLAAGGSSGVLRIWDTLGNLGVRKTFGDRLKEFGRGELEKERGGDELIVPEGEGESDDSEDEDEGEGEGEGEEAEEVIMQE